jgi:hypothetical protein
MDGKTVNSIIFYLGLGGARGLHGHAAAALAHGRKGSARPGQGRPASWPAAAPGP